MSVLKTRINDLNYKLQAIKNYLTVKFMDTFLRQKMTCCIQKYVSTLTLFTLGNPPVRMFECVQKANQYLRLLSNISLEQSRRF